MYTIEKTFVVSIAHNLKLDHESKCVRLHGHDLKVTVYCRSEVLDVNSMVIDFTKIKELISNKLDHYYLNEIKGVGFIITDSDLPSGGTPINPTAENLAHWILDQINGSLVLTNPMALCYKVDVQETEGSTASYLVEE